MTMWSRVGDDFCALANEMFSTGSLSEFLNRGLINIIPKNSIRDTIGGWHPNMLLGISYKIMAKTLAVRIQGIAKKVVHQELTSFVLG